MTPSVMSFASSPGIRKVQREQRAFDLEMVQIGLDGEGPSKESNPCTNKEILSPEIETS